MTDFAPLNTLKTDHVDSGPLLSVIIPVYKAEAYLRDTLDSILTRDAPDMEILCVNDGSPDGSAAILSEYAQTDPRIRVIDQPNGGTGSARNHGVREAAGKYLYFMDCDDLLEPGALAQAAASMEARDLEYLCFNAEAFGEDPESAAVAAEKNLNYFRRNLDEGRVFTGQALMKAIIDDPDSRFSAPVWQCMIRRDFFLEHRLWFSETILNEDEPWTFAVLMKVKRAGCLNRKLYRYRIHKGSIMGTPADFRHAYSYYLCAQAFYQTIADPDFVCEPGMEDTLVWYAQFITRNGIYCYRKCSNEEKNKRLELPLETRMAFEAAIAYPAMLHDKLQQARDELRAAEALLPLNEDSGA